MAIVSKATATAWAKVKFYYQHDLASVVFTKAQSNATGVTNLYTRDELTFFKAADSTTSCYAQIYDSGASEEITADYLVAGWHTLGSTGATVTLEAYNIGTTSFDIIVDAYAPSSDDPFVIEFAEVSSYSWKLTLNYASGQRPQIAMAYWGLLTELDYCATAFDPNAENRKANLQINDKGFLSTVDSLYVERPMTLQFNDVNDALYAKLKAWHETIRRNQFFVAWDIDAHPGDLFIMRSKDGKLMAPYNIAARRSVAINLVGRV